MDEAGRLPLMRVNLPLKRARFLPNVNSGMGATQVFAEMFSSSPLRAA